MTCATFQISDVQSKVEFLFYLDHWSTELFYPLCLSAFSYLALCSSQNLTKKIVFRKRQLELQVLNFCSCQCLLYIKHLYEVQLAKIFSLLEIFVHPAGRFLCCTEALNFHIITYIDSCNDFLCCWGSIKKVLTYVYISKCFT